MKIIENILAQLTDADLLLESVCQAIAAIDSNSVEELTAYHDGVQALTQEVSGAEEYLSAMRQELASDVRYALWQGLKWNLDCFQNPVNKLRLNMEFEELYQEARMHTFPEAQIAHQRINVFLRTLPKNKRELLDPVIDYYAYIKTYAYKLAHYAGFCMAERLLPCFVPGYVNDPTLTMRYAHQIEMTLGKTPFSKRECQ